MVRLIKGANLIALEKSIREHIAMERAGETPQPVTPHLLAFLDQRLSIRQYVPENRPATVLPPATPVLPQVPRTPATQVEAVKASQEALGAAAGPPSLSRAHSTVLDAHIDTSLQEQNLAGRSSQAELKQMDDEVAIPKRPENGSQSLDATKAVSQSGLAKSQSLFAGAEPAAETSGNAAGSSAAIAAA